MIGTKREKEYKGDRLGVPYSVPYDGKLAVTY